MTAIPSPLTNLPNILPTNTLQCPALVRLGRLSWMTFWNSQRRPPLRTPSIPSARPATTPASSEPQIPSVSPLSSLCHRSTHPKNQRVSVPRYVHLQVRWVSNGHYSRRTRTLKLYCLPPKIHSPRMPSRTNPSQNHRHLNKTPLCSTIVKVTIQVLPYPEILHCLANLRLQMLG